ncbi:MAG: hypothetical protein IJM72_01470 [Deltaproteobacteria bacterium]|jgi:Fe-S cluster assembly iron-binding protein IscA|nr:hypothetical protein [Deltaproteobacteria bacterium]
MIEISPAAREVLEEYLKKSPDKVVRIAFDGLGCSGPNMKLSLEAFQEGMDLKDVDGIRVLLDEEVDVFSEDQIIDYLDGEKGKGFALSSRGGIAACSGDCSACSSAR